MGILPTAGYGIEVRVHVRVVENRKKCVEIDAACAAYLRDIRQDGETRQFGDMAGRLGFELSSHPHDPAVYSQ